MESSHRKTLKRMETWGTYQFTWQTLFCAKTASTIIMMINDLYITTQSDLENAVTELGFLPFFRNSIPGFSIEEHVSYDAWYYAEGDWKAWEWKGPVINNLHCGYGKFFEKKAAYISPEWFPDFANYRRDGYDFDARYEDELAYYKDKRLYILHNECNDHIHLCLCRHP